jgi:antitoxin ChpS
MAVTDGCLVINPKPKPHYTMAELLTASDYIQPQPAHEREWVEAPAAGDEII